ncbi:MAG: FKBP-type peptidyl-prolyl cis-trans isomerase [Myxococcota bacterium]|nr:FKBP-type peptidyl-prolyl cis-trans isomerase [Myxococcota bacterium]
MRTLLLIAVLGLTLGCGHSRPQKTSKTTNASTPTARGARTARTEGHTAQPATPIGHIPAPVDVAAPPADATTTPSGLAFKVLVPGTGTERPSPEDTVRVHYSGWTTDGKMFDSSVMRGSPAEFPLNAVIKGWTEGVGLMVVGEERRLWIPGSLAYGDTPKRPGAPVGTLVFDVELLDIIQAPSPEEVARLFAAFEVALREAAEGACACKDMACAEPFITKLQRNQPTARPTPEQQETLEPHMERIRACLQRIYDSGHDGSR